MIVVIIKGLRTTQEPFILHHLNWRLYLLLPSWSRSSRGQTAPSIPRTNGRRFDEDFLFTCRNTGHNTKVKSDLRIFCGIYCDNYKNVNNCIAVTQNSTKTHKKRLSNLLDNLAKFCILTKINFEMPFGSCMYRNCDPLMIVILQ